jgi:hypothetical protein
MKVVLLTRASQANSSCSQLDVVKTILANGLLWNSTLLAGIRSASASRAQHFSMHDFSSAQLLSRLKIAD